MSSNSPHDPAVTGAARYLLYLLLLAAGCLAVVVWAARLDTIEFDAATWRGRAGPVPPEDRDLRLRMVDDLLAVATLEGLNRQDVLQLLGEPDSQLVAGEPGAMMYFLGPQRGLFRFDTEWLVVCFDSEEVVDRAWLKTS